VAHENKILADQNKTAKDSALMFAPSTWLWYLLPGPPRKRGGFLLPCELMSDDRLVYLMVAITGLSVLIALSMLATLVLR
jgi:hypothetical protein